MAAPSLRPLIRSLAVAGGALALGLGSELRPRRTLAPLTDRWRTVPIAARGSTLLGISYRTPQVEAFQLDARQALQELLSYPFQLIRLGAYWRRIEPDPGGFDPGELDEQIDQAARAGKRIIVCVGALKCFGYPEFFVPDHRLPEPLREGRLVLPVEHPALVEAATAFVSRIVERYRDRDEVVAWQVEHEAVDPLGLEHSWRLSTEFVRKELTAVRRADPSRPVLLNGFLPTSLLGGAQQWWRTHDQGDSLAFAVESADIVGLDVYPTIGLLSLGPFTLYLDGSQGPVPMWARSRLLKQAAAAGRQVMISEGQAEPWETVTVPPALPRMVPASCPPDRLIETYNQCMHWSQRLGITELYAYVFWGAEYWLLRAKHGDTSYLDAFARILSPCSD